MAVALLSVIKPVITLMSSINQGKCFFCLFHTKHWVATKYTLVTRGFNLTPRSLQESYRREKHATFGRVQECNADLSFAHVFTAKFPVLGIILSQGQRRVFRNKIVFVFFIKK